MKLAEKEGFTLLEVLTAAAIMIIVCGFILKISSHVLDIWGRASEELESENEMRLVLDVIENDLETSLPYYWTYDVGVEEGLEKTGRLCFYGYGETDIPNAIVYEVGYDELKSRYGIYRYVRRGNKKYDCTEKLEEGFSMEKMPSKEITKPSNLLARDVKSILVKFFYKDSQGKMEEAVRVPFEGTVICAEVVVRGNKEEELRRKITLVGIARL